MKTLRFTFLAACMVACSALFIFSCSKVDKNKMDVSMETADAYYTPSVLKSKAITELPDYTSKEELAKTVLELANKNFNTSEVQITDLSLHPSFNGLEFSYKLSSGEETNALLVDSKSLGKIEVQTDQLELNGENVSDLILGDYVLLETN